MFRYHLKALIMGAFLFLSPASAFSQQVFEGTATFTFPGWGNYAPVSSFRVSEMTYEQLCAFAPEFYEGPRSGTPPHTTTVNYFTVAVGDAGWLGTGTTYTDTSGQCFVEGHYIQETCNSQGDCSQVRQKRTQSIAYIVYEYTVPPPDPCLDNFTENCCVEQAQQSCSALGGVASYSFLDDTMIGGPACDFVCVDDIEPEDPLPEPPLYTDLSLIEQYLYYILSNQWPTTNAIVDAVNSIEIEGESYNEYLDEIIDLLTDISEASGADFSELEPYLVDLLAGQLTPSEFLTGIEQVTGALDDLEFSVGDITVDTENLESLVAQTNSLLAALFSDDTSLHDIDSHDWDIPVPGIAEDGSISDASVFESFLNDISSSFGIDLEPDLSELQQDEIFIDEYLDDYQFSLPASSCPAPRILNINGAEITVVWDPFCQLFEVLGTLIIIFAYILVPFIVFGARMRIGG